jgi:predicted transposase/invertase (TIGR01784 family)
MLSSVSVHTPPNDVAPVMTTTPHDALFKAVFSRTENAVVALKPLLPAALAEATDWASLTLEPGSYIDDDLTERQSDLLFRVRISDTEARMYLLFEHQSEPDPRMPFRLLRYMIRIWEQIERTESEAHLPAIIPVVLSHAERGWHVPTSFEDTLDLGAMKDHLLPHIPRFRYIVDDLASASDDEINERVSSLYVRIVMRLLRDGRRLPISLVFQQCADLLRAIGQSTPIESIELLLRYAVYLSETADREPLRAVLATIATDKDHTMRNLADSLLETVEARGIEKGIATGIEQGRADSLRSVLRKLLLLKFGAVSPSVDSKVASASVDVLDAWVGRVLTSESADEVVG